MGPMLRNNSNGDQSVAKCQNDCDCSQSDYGRIVKD